MDPPSSQLANKVTLSTKVETLWQERLLHVCLEHVQGPLRQDSGFSAFGFG